MTPNQAKTHFTDLLNDLRSMKASPWPFLCAAAMIEYLAKMTVGNGRRSYIDFIKTYMRRDYSTFRFKNGDTDLPEQIYHVLRCGMVHSFSLTPDLNDYKKGRNESIVISHSGNHLTNYLGTDGHHLDAVRLVFGMFADDIGTALQKVFVAADGDAELRGRITSHLRAQPPIQSLLPSSSPPSAPPVSLDTSTFAVSGSTHR